MSARDNKMVSRPSSRIIDVLLLLMAISTVITADLAFDYRSNLMILLCFAAVVGSVTYFSVLPWIRSRPLTPAEREKIGLPDGVRIRVSQSDGFRAIDLIFRRCVVVPRRVLESTKSEHRFQVIHEAGHLQNRDPLFFHYIFPSVLAAGLVSGFIAVFSPEQLFSNPLSDAIGNRQFMEEHRRLIVLIVGAGFPLFSFSVAALTLREREFSADHWANVQTGGTYVEHLKRQARLEHYRRPANALIRLWNRFTHPSYQRRLKSLDLDQSMLTRPGIVFGIAFTSLMIVQLYNLAIGGLAGGIVNAVQLLANQSEISNFTLALAFAPLFLMAISFVSLGGWLSLVAANSALNDRPARQFLGICSAALVLALAFQWIGKTGVMLLPEADREFSMPGHNPSLIAGYQHVVAFLGLCIFWTIWHRITNWISFNFFFHAVIGMGSFFILLFIF